MYKLNIIYLFIALLTGISSAMAQPAHYKAHVRMAADTNLVLPPSWAFGVLYGGYTNQHETIERIEEIIKHDYPIDAYWIDSWFWSYAEQGRGPKKYIDFVADTIAFPNRTQMWDFMTKNNIKGGFWTWDCILETGNEEAFNDFKTRGYFANTYLETNTWHNSSTSTAMFQDENDKKKGTLCGNINFDDPQAVRYFKERMKHFFDEGADFIKLDRTAKVSVSKAMFEMSQEFGKETKGRGFMLAHSFVTDNEEYKRYPAKWTDDTRSDWTIEKPLVQFAKWAPPVALKENIAMFTNPAKPSSRIPFLTNDMGGFTVGNVPKPEEELFIRWMEFSMFNPIVEAFSEPENTTSNLAWKYSERADSLFRFYAHQRMQFFPYIYSYALRCRTEAKPMLGKFPEQIYQFTFGDELLVAPVYERGATFWKVSLPEGKWINYWTGENLNGNAEHTVAAPIHQIPLFVKQGSIIPMRNYASSIEKGNNNTILLHVYPGADGSFELLEDDGTSNEYLKGIYASTSIALKNSPGKFVLTINPVQGNYEGMGSSRDWILLIHTAKKPGKIILRSKKLPFTFDKVKKTARVEIPKSPVNKAQSVVVQY